MELKDLTSSNQLELNIRNFQAGSISSARQLANLSAEIEDLARERMRIATHVNAKNAQREAREIEVSETAGEFLKVQIETNKTMQAVIEVLKQLNEQQVSSEIAAEKRDKAVTTLNNRIFILTALGTIFGAIELYKNFLK